MAEDGPIDPRYPVNETKSSEYGERTEKNVGDSDGTLILTWGAPTGGTDFTIQMAEKHKKPYLVIDLGETKDPTEVGIWIKALAIGVMNVAGPRESKNPGIYQKAKKFLREVLSVLESIYLDNWINLFKRNAIPTRTMIIQMTILPARNTFRIFYFGFTFEADNQGSVFLKRHLP